MLLTYVVQKYFQVRSSVVVAEVRREEDLQLGTGGSSCTGCDPGAIEGGDSVNELILLALSIRSSCTNCASVSPVVPATK